jgi:hypothetical protein
MNIVIFLVKKNNYGNILVGDYQHLYFYKNNKLTITK